MKYGNIKMIDSSNGKGVRVSLYVSGCRNHCKGCFNPETWSFSGGYELPSDIKGQIVKAISNNGIQSTKIMECSLFTSSIGFRQFRCS